MKKEMKMLSVVFIVVLVGVFIVAYRYYQEDGNLNVNPNLSPGVDAYCTGDGVQYAKVGDASCGQYALFSSRYKIYPDQNANPVTIKSYIKGSTSNFQTMTCSSTSYCYTPQDGYVVEVTDSSGDRDCYYRGTLVRNGVYDGVNCVASVLNIKSGVAYVQFSDLVWNPNGKVIFFNENQEDVYPGFDYSSGNIVGSTAFVTEIISTTIYPSESAAFNLQSSRPGDTLGSGAGKIYEMSMIVRDGSTVIFKASSYCDLTSGANGVKKTTIEGSGLTQKVITATSCPLTFGGSEGNGVDSRVELKPSELSLGKGRARIMGTEYFFNEFTANRSLTLEFKVSRRADMRHNLRLFKFEGMKGNPNKLQRPRQNLVLNWDRGSYLQSINKWVWNTGTQTLNNIKVKAEVRNETNDLIGVYESTTTISPKGEKKVVSKPVSAGVGITLDPDRGIYLPYDSDGTCYDIKFYVNENQFLDEGFDICVS